MAYALQPARGEPLTARARRWLTLAAAVIIVLVGLPLLIIIGLPWLLALRRLERRDPVSTQRPDRGRVERLRSREDAVAHNPFAALGVVKAGRARRTIYATLADVRQRMNATPHREPTEQDWLAPGS